MLCTTAVYTDKDRSNQRNSKIVKKIQNSAWGPFYTVQTDAHGCLGTVVQYRRLLCYFIITNILMNAV